MAVPRHTLRKHAAGITLLELLIVVAVIAIIASFALPSYREYTNRSNRSEGQAMLNEAAARQERYFGQNNAYVTTAANIAKLGVRTSTASGVTSDTGKYTLSVSSAAGDGGYTLTASQQFGDTACGNLTLNARGVRGRTGSGKSIEDCWR